MREAEREEEEGRERMEEVSQVNNSALAGFSSPTARGVSTWVSHGDRQQMKRGTTISSEE